MPLFFFHVLDECWYFDKTGEELPDASAALFQATQVAKEVLEDAEGVYCEQARVEVMDAFGRIAGVVSLRDVSRDSSA
jgi:hypothetical protein